MQTTHEAQFYQNPVGSADFSQAAFPGLATRFATVNDINAALATFGVYVPFAENCQDKFLRLSLGCAINGADGTQMLERTYLVFPTSLDGKAGLRLDLALSITWTSSAVAVLAAAGGRANHFEAKAVVATETGLLASRTGLAAGQVSQSPARVDIMDVGEAVGVVRVFSKPGVNAANGCAPLGDRWR